MRDAAARPIAVTVLTGFLGAGKTTLLNAWLRQPAFARTAVVVNEFGEVGVDDALIENVSGDMLSLVTGCVCCAARGDLVDAVANLLDRGSDGSAFARIVIETTGLADPGPVLNALLLAPAVTGRVRPETVLTVVSASDGGAVIDRHPEARRQVALADRILLSRTDLPDGAARADALERRLATLAPLAVIGDARAATTAVEPSRRAPRRIASAADHHHHGADARIRSTVLEAGPVDRARLALFLDLLIERHGGALLRLKGLAALADDPSRPVVVQVVGGLLHPAPRLPSWPDGVIRTRLVAILEDRDPSLVAALWCDVFGPPAIDRPDAAALARSPEDGPGLF